MADTLILGAGYSGRAYAAQLIASGKSVTGTTRSADKAADLEKARIKALIFDGQRNTPLDAALAEARHIIVSIGPNEAGDPVITALSQTLARSQNLAWIAYLSTVGVYGNHDGAWVDEKTPVKPVSARSKQRVAAESAWQSLAKDIGVPLSILRLSGIYGPGRNQMVSLTNGKARRLIKPGQVFNRVHVDDIARALAFLADRHADGLWNVTDNKPAPPQDVVAYCAALMKIDPLPELDFETATLTPMARSFYGENKRVSNAKIKQAGFEFAYPDYETSFARMWADNTWA